MAFTETPKEKEKRLAYYAKNKAVADDKEAKAAAEDLRKFNETTKVDTSENTNPMGDTYKKGGTVSKADMQKAGFYDKDKTKSERQAIVSKVTTKPQRVAIVEKAFSTKNMKSGGSVSSASKRADGCCVKGKTRGKIC
jgi:hypothetical protein